MQLLKEHWGYSSFRPRQQAIVESILAERDTAVVMPTGGGKSLCYQLPAVASGRTAVVISPLIALMRDQTASLSEIGISAAFVNSTLDFAALTEIQRRAESGDFRLLYLSPERLVRDDTLAWLGRIPLAFFAIDEAHCISEWGHEFRPEYRQLRVLRERFPAIPIAAFTASATRRVRHDIVAQLGLRDPAKIALSFHRPNLRYFVHQYPKGPLDLLAAAMEHYAEGNIIVYAPTIKRVEETAAALALRGFPALAYHGQMGAAARDRNQELWMIGEKRILVGTLAFGLGINKPDVRAVIHLALPKSVEQYYQEAGRAGRDGHPADCILLWRKADAGLLVHFIQEIQDRAERERAWGRYRAIRDFAENRKCRHRQICLYFGETPKWERCGACDVCGAGLEWLNASSPSRRAAASRAAHGLSPARQGGVSGEAMPPAAPAPKLPGTSVDTNLRDALKQWRLAEAKAQSVAAFVILHDSTLEELCRRRPRSIADLLEVPGIGERKAQRFGSKILQLIAGGG
jgi:ATP-dependent DNA helicase RecQ